MFLIPIGTDQKFRKFPVISVVLIFLMIVTFFITSSQRRELIERENFLIAKIRTMISDHLMQQDGYLKGYWTDIEERIESLTQEVLKGEFGNINDERTAEKIGDAVAEISGIISRDPYRRFGFLPGRPSLLGAVTCAFLHADIMHLASNLYFLFLFGAFIEDFLGKKRYLIYFLVCSIAASYFHGMLAPTGMKDIPLIGASGAISGLMSGFLIFFLSAKIRYFLFLFLFFRFYTKTFFLPSFVALPVWFLMEVFNHIASKGESDVAHSGHIGGFLAGLLITAVIRLSPLYEKFKDDYFREATIENPDSYLDDIDDLIAEQKYREALNIAREGLRVRPDYMPLIRQKLRIYKLMEDKPSILSVYKDIFRITAANGEMNAGDFIDAYSQFGLNVTEKKYFPEILRQLNHEYNFEGTENFAGIFLKEIKDKGSKLYSMCLLYLIRAYIASHKFYEAVIKISEGLLLYSGDKQESDKYLELQREVFFKMMPGEPPYIEKLLALEECRIKKNRTGFIALYDEISRTAAPAFTFEQLLYRSELIDETTSYREIVGIYKKLSTSFEQHPLIHIVYFRMGELILKIKKDRTTALKYLSEAQIMCKNAEHSEKIRLRIKELEK